MAPDLGLRQVFHLLVVAYYVRFDTFVFTVLIPNVLAVDNLDEELVWMAAQFATLWAQIAFQDYFVLSVLEDVLAWTPHSFWRPLKQFLSDHANNLLTIYVIPGTCVMCVNFWIVFSIDSKLIDENNLVFDVFDRSTNHVVHTSVVPILLVELYVTRRRYPASLTVAYPYATIATTLATYFAVVFGTKLFSPVWPYPFFREMTASQWALYISVNILLACVAYAVGFFCNAFVWGKHDAGSTQSSSVEGGWPRGSVWRKLLRVVQIVESR